MRSLVKSWSDKKPFIHRIRWYEGQNDIRLNLETTEGRWNVWPKNEEDAQRIWDDFKQNYQNFKFGSESHAS